jgi:hypothetical protein
MRSMLLIINNLGITGREFTSNLTPFILVN